MSLDVQRISLDISKRPTPQQVRLGQGDANGTQLIADIFDDGVAYSLEDYDVRLEMRLPAGDMYYSVDGAKSGNTATFDIDETYAATCFGFDGFGYVDILDGDEVICSTSRFQLVVLRNAQDGADPSTAYSNGIIEATERAIAAAEAAEGVVLQDVPLMSETLRGGAQVGDGLEIADGALYVDATGIANGALPVAHGGTGSTSASDARTALGVYSTGDVDTALAGKAAASHTHAAADVTSGQLAIANGGTGSSTADDARQALNASREWYATSSTAAGTAAKTASCTGFVLEPGAAVDVRFTNANTAASPTLDVNSTGAKAIYANNSTTAANVSWVAGETVHFVYDGTYWRMANSVAINSLREYVSAERTRLDVSSGLTRGDLILLKVGNVVHVSGDFHSASGISVNTAIYQTIPSSLRPSYGYGIPGIFVLANNTSASFTVTINSDGTVTQSLSNNVVSGFVSGQYQL